MAKLIYRNGDGTQIAAYHFEYDSLGRLIRSTEHNANNTITQHTEHLYDEFSRLSSQSWVVQGDSFTESYTYNDPDPATPNALKDGSLKSMTTATGDTINYSYDGLKRLSSTAIKNSSGTTLFRTGYAYKAGAQADLTSTRIGVYTTWNPDYTIINSNSYVYDAVGNITQVKDAKNGNRLLAEYSYDVQNQLTQEVIYDYDSDGIATTTIYAYTYDTAGNIQTESKNGVLTKRYAYEDTAWNDLLTEFNGTEFEYDSIGNPISYENVKNEYLFRWVNGRRLSQATVDGAESYCIGYDYDLDGIRTKKTVTVDSTGVTTTHNYVTQNGKVVRETINNGTTTRMFDFIYDASGRPFAVKYTINGTTSAMFYYVLNLQGDVVKIIAENGTVMANYSYNAWGEVLSVTNASGTAITASGHLANLNPIRYRGYYYDTETGFYYLQSRYYDPTMHRFINADSYQSTGQGVLGHNMFAYCLNNPTFYIDESGDKPWLLWWLGKIHNMVVAAVCLQVGGTSEVRVTNGSQSGRLDVYVESNDTYYEIKSEYSALKASTERQMEKYDEAIPVDRFLPKRPVHRGTAQIKGEFDINGWHIEYRLLKSGLVVYSYEPPEMDSKTNLQTAAAIALGLAFYAMGGGEKVREDLWDPEAQPA